MLTQPGLMSGSAIAISLYAPSHGILKVVSPFSIMHNVSQSSGAGMSGLMFYLVLISLVGLLIISVRYSKASGNVRLLALHLVILCVFSFLVWLFYQRSGVLTARGGSRDNELAFILGLYVFMLVGMLAHSGYRRFVHPQIQKPPFDFGMFISPVFASTFVFIPLLASLQNDATNLEGMVATKMMLFFVAFENGFLWKEYFDSRRMEKAVASNL